VGEPVAVAQAPSAEPAVAEPAREEPAAEAPPVAPAGGAPVYVPDTGGAGDVGEAPDVIIEDARPRDEPPLEEPPPVEIEDARPREEPRYEPAAEAPPPAVVENAPPRDEPGGDPATYWIQVGAFTSATNAAQLSSRLKADGFFPEVEIGIVEGQGYYRVRLGPYAMPTAAARLDEDRRRLEARGYPARQVDD
jgi:cell division septation protein DedD